MGLEKWNVETLSENLSEMRGFLHEAALNRTSNSPLMRARGETQYPILAKVVEVLRKELDDRLRDAEDLEHLGCTIREIEKREAEDAALFEAEHPEVLERPQRVIDPAFNFLDREFFRDPPDYDEEAALEAAVGGPPTQDPILRAMRKAAQDVLQRLGASTLSEYLEEVWIKKHHDYGPENHAIWGCQGAIIRATDKLMRLRGAYFLGREMKIVENDWLDMIGYGLIGLVIERGQWPVIKLHSVMESMKAVAEAKELTFPSGLSCPACSSHHVQVYQSANAEGRAWCRCGIECMACHTKIGGAMHIATGESLEVAVQRGIDEWQVRHNRR